MNNNRVEEMQELFRQASEIASVVPDAMQAEAFNRALESLTGGLPSPSQTQRKKSQSSNKPSSKQSDKAASFNESWYQELDSTRYPNLVDAPNALTKILIVLRVAKDEFATDGLTPANISSVLDKKFRINISPSTVAARLGGASKLVSRTEHGTGYMYRIMHPGEQYLDGKYTGSVGGGGKPKSKTKKTTTNGTVETPSASTKTKKSSKSRPSGRDLLVKLKSEGFFDEPQTISDIIAYAAKNLAYTYRPGDLSTPLVRLVRSQELKRDTNDDNQFEYSAR